MSRLIAVASSSAVRWRRLVIRTRLPPVPGSSGRAGLAIELETVAAALEQVASFAATADDNDALLARALYARFATERAIERVVMSAATALGGMSFIESPEIAYLLGATRALAFHPPSRAAAAGPVARYLAGGPLIL
jgi:alkylation response protein AidB-like acyl-CoA dehydrogenase